MARGGFRRAKREQPEAAKADVAPVVSEPEHEPEKPKATRSYYVLTKAVILKGKVRNAGEEIRREELSDFDERLKAGRIEAREG